MYRWYIHYNSVCSLSEVRDGCSDKMEGRGGRPVGPCCCSLCLESSVMLGHVQSKTTMREGHTGHDQPGQQSTWRCHLKQWYVTQLSLCQHVCFSWLRPTIPVQPALPHDGAEPPSTCAACAACAYTASAGTLLLRHTQRQVTGAI